MLNLAYLFDPRPGPLPPQDFHLSILLTAIFAIGLGVSLAWWFLRPPSWPMGSMARLEIPLSALALGLLMARFMAIPFLSMRALFYGTTVVSLGGWAICLGRLGDHSGLLRRQLGLLTFSWEKDRPPLPLPATVFLLGGHVVGLTLLAADVGRSYTWMAGLFLLLLSPQLLYCLWARKRHVHLEALTPLWLAYGAGVARRLLAKLLIQPLPLYDGFAYPDPLSSLANLEAVLVTCVVYALLCQGYLLFLRTNRLDRYLLFIGVSLLSVVLIWAGAEYLIHRTRGVTANDPYAYAQMAVDISQNGHPLHRFTLFPRISNLGISWWPVVHYGYQVRVPPLRGDGSTAADWPVGWPIVLSLGHLLLGEEGLYLSNPIVGLLCLGATVALMAEVLYDKPWNERLLAGALAAFALATSYEQIDRLLVPMADASAQLFTVLTLLFVLRAMRGRHRVYAVMGGVCFGWVYFIRHTQLALGLSAVVAVIVLARSQLTRKERWEFIGLFGLASFLVAVPDLLYHQSVFGHFLTPESTELDLYNLINLPASAVMLLERSLSGNEFGYLSPLILYGGYRMFVERRGEFLALLTAALAILLVHLPYAALRMRDLLSLFPILLVWGAYGTLDLWRRVYLHKGQMSYRRYASSTVIVLALLLLPCLRTWSILPRPWGSHRASFGSVSAEERREFDILADYTMEGSVVGSSLNGGAIDLYANREAFRPAFWTGDELDVFFEEMFREGRAVYLLDDGEAVHPSIEHAKAHYDVDPVTRLLVPVFGDPNRISGVLYRIQPQSQESQ